MVGTNSIDDSLVAKEFKGSRWRTGKKKEVLKARNKNMKKNYRGFGEAKVYREVVEAGRGEGLEKSF